MARLVFGLNQSLDGYVDHDAFGPGRVRPGSDHGLTPKCQTGVGPGSDLGLTPRCQIGVRPRSDPKGDYLLDPPSGGAAVV